MRVSCLVLSAVVLIPAAAWAQMSDAEYCKALSQQYQKYVSNMESGHNPMAGQVDAQTAISQCQAGNTAAGIPVLEQKLRDARVDLPKRS